ncbi:MAG: Na+/H+ antiporter NhaC [Sphaerochaetaceae bacterium]|nr:Na+/H+ antiporter NhaC [Sphaerochaetaceae bacterium]
MSVRKPTLMEAAIPIVAVFILLGIGYGVFGLSTHGLLVIAAFVAAIIAHRVGYNWDQMFEGIKEKISSSLTSIFVMIAVGAVIGSWIVAGTIPMLIYYGVKIISPKFLLVTAFLVTALVATFTGTSFGSAGTIGVAIMGIAAALGISLPAAAGAVIAGAVFGDKLSPFSDTTILAPTAAGSQLYDHIKHMLYTTVPASLLGIIIYLIVGFTTPTSSITSPEKVQLLLSQLSTLFNWNILLLLPPVIIFYGAFRKKPTVPYMLLSSVVAGILGMIFQKFSLKSAFTGIIKGFNVSLIPESSLPSGDIIKEISTLLNRGGMMGMMNTVLLIICALSFAGILSKYGAMEVILNSLKNKIKTVGQLVSSTVFATILMALATGSSYMAILIPGELFKDMYKEKGLAAKNLSRTLEDSGTCVVPIVPWSIAGTFMAGTLGVPTLSYLPWAVMCYTGFLFAILFGFTGFGIAKLEKESDN